MKHKSPLDKHLYYGDNLDVLRENILDDSVDLVYLDPPFNSQSTYNILFRSPTGEQSKAQIEAFEDSWHWNDKAEIAFDQVMISGNVDAAEMLRAMRSFLNENDMMAYLTMMAVRLLELRRILKQTGTLYLHCDPTASHYLKVILDAIFGQINFRNEISWRRSNPKSLGKMNFANCRDIIFRYTKSNRFTFNPMFGEHDPDYLEKAYRYVDEKGRRYRLLPLLNPNDDRPNLTYEFLGVNRVWRWTKERMAKAYDSGLVVQLKPGAVPQYKKYLDDSRGRTISNDWSDINPISTTEELGYPTQKPLALLERIILSSTNDGDTVLDPFCGCGTAIHAAQKVGRAWVGIDVTHLAISLIEKRLDDAFPGIEYQVHGTPKDIEGARALAERDKYQFQWWAVSLLNAVPYGGKKKGADSGIDGLIYFKPDGRATERAVVSVKGGYFVGVGMIKDLIATVDREKAKVGIFVTLASPTRPMVIEAMKCGFYDSPHHGKVPKIQIMTIQDLFDGRKPQIPMIDRMVFRRAQKEHAERQESFL